MIATVAQVKAAQAFLRYLGADWHNNYLLIAVVAWMMQESGGHIIGNNPFNLRPAKDIADFMSGVRQSANGNGQFAVFATLEKGLQAAAARLVRAGHDWRGYDLAVAAARRGDPVDFLVGLALSAWDAAHYGVGPGDNPADPTQNHLLRVYYSYTGLQVPAPTSPRPKQPRPPRKPHVPKFLKPQFLVPNYLSGFAAHRFYNERHHAGADGLDKGDR